MPLCLLVVALAAGDSPSSWGYPLRASRCWLPLAGAALAAPCGCRPGRPLHVGPGHGRLPLQGTWSWPATRADGLTMADCPLSSLRLPQKRSKNV
ncbi:hypothetical protein BHE74_00007730 [Ensete ventricosum]|nr:hypothetical protein BHE74_00007730 [Ensete ventricosum]RZS05201.1 hypothetical protein BHM03_00035671 [Ensete ventricosum]